MAVASRPIRNLTALARPAASLCRQIRQRCAAPQLALAKRGLHRARQQLAAVVSPPFAQLDDARLLDAVIPLMAFAPLVWRHHRPDRQPRNLSPHGWPDQVDDALIRTAVEAVQRAAGGDETTLALLDELWDAMFRCPLDAVFAQATPGLVRSELGRFYETFLSLYSPAQRRARGVYFTPPAVVSYLVRSTDEVLRQDFGIAQGLSFLTDPNCPSRLQIVDPACGCGTFLSAVAEWSGLPHGLPPDRCGGLTDLPDHPLASLLGLEVMPATCAAAHLLLRCQFDVQRRRGRLDKASIPSPRPNIHLANALEIGSDFLQHSWQKADRLLVVIGNPPYGAFGRGNRSPAVQQLLQRYKEGLRERKRNLDDDFIKFIAWSQQQIEMAGRGVLAFITSNTYLTGLTHRQMRHSLLESFDNIYLLDLHGSGKKREVCPDGSRDENVFDIQQGVALGIFVKHNATADKPPGRILHADLWGRRDDKLAVLNRTHVGSTSWSGLSPSPEQFFFVPRRENEADQYREFVPLDQVFGRFISGVQTKNDKWFVDFDSRDLCQRIKALLEEPQPERNAVDRSPAPSPGVRFSSDRIRHYLVAPFDRRWVYYDRHLLGRSRYQVMQHMLRPNLGLVFMRQSTNRADYDHFLAVRSLISDRMFYSAHGAPFLAPLWIYEQGGRRVPNLTAAVLDKFAPMCAVQGSAREACHGPASCAEEVMAYMYAVFYSPSYRRRFHEQLRVDFPRVPLPQDRRQFQQLCRVGRQLLALHLLEPPPALETMAHFPMRGDNRVAKAFPKYAPPQDGPAGKLGGRVYINARQFFDSVAPEIWQFRIGGYAVLARWLRQRRGRTLSTNDIVHFQQITSVLSETMRLMAQLAREPEAEEKGSRTP